MLVVIVMVIALGCRSLVQEHTIYNYRSHILIAIDIFKDVIFKDVDFLMKTHNLRKVVDW